MGLRNDLLRVSGSNLIVMLSSIVNGLVLPYVLSIDSFADLKTYTLYASFIGFLHFGFVDGLNIKYGGQRREDIDKIEFNGFHNFFITFQLFILLLVILIGIIINNSIILFVGLAILPINLQSFFLYYFQAIGEFKDYSMATIIVPVINIILTLIFVFIGVVDYRVYIVTIIISYSISIILLEMRYRLYSNYHFVINLESHMLLNGFKMYRAIFMSGFFIMLGNVLFTLFFDTGRWISKFFTDNEGFAKYSLGISLIGFVMIFIGAINKTFYPYLYRNNNTDLILKYKNILYIIGSFSLIGFFPLQLLITRFLPKYVESLPITAVLITSIPGMMIIKSIYVNLYKVQKKEKRFLFDTLIYLIIAILLNFILYLYFKTLISIAIASVISIYIWSIFPMTCLKIKKNEILKDVLYLIVFLSIFWFIYLIDCNIMLKIIFLAISLLFLNLLFFKKMIFNLLNIRV